jgi:hypothetical protein
MFSALFRALHSIAYRQRALAHRMPTPAAGHQRTSAVVKRVIGGKIAPQTIRRQASLHAQRDLGSRA